jgi:hypothetical protein
MLTFMSKVGDAQAELPDQVTDGLCRLSQLQVAHTSLRYLFSNIIGLCFGKGIDILVQAQI